MAGCDNDDRYPQMYVLPSHVSELRFHYFPSGEKKQKIWEIWVEYVSRGLIGFEATDNTTVCSNYFIDGKPTKRNTNPTLYLMGGDMSR